MTLDNLNYTRQIREAWSALKYAITSSNNEAAVRASACYVNTELSKIISESPKSAKRQTIQG